jgi:DNA repair exonuclease SbcCD ATPase subunit
MSDQIDVYKTDTNGVLGQFLPSEDFVILHDHEVFLEAALAAANEQIAKLQQENERLLEEINSKNRLLPSLLAEGKQIETQRAMLAEVRVTELQQENERLKAICPTRWWCCTADYPNHDENCPNNADALKARVQVLEKDLREAQKEPWGYYSDALNPLPKKEQKP